MSAGLHPRGLFSSKEISVGEVRIRFNWLVTFCVLLGVAGLARLGLWQLDRAQEKIQLQNDYLAMQQLPPVPLMQLGQRGRGAASGGLRNRQVLLEGEYLNDKSIFLVYQPFREQIGYEILTPFRDAASGMIVVVSRGWTAASSYERLRDALPRPSGGLALRGQIHVPEAPAPAPANAALLTGSLQWPLQRRFLNVNALAPQFEAPLFPYVVRLSAGEPGVLVRHWDPVRVETERNFSYALQWFSMALALLIAALLISSNILSLLQERGKPL